MVAFTSAHSEMILDEVLAALGKSELSDRQKRVYARRLKFRPRIREMILDEVVSQAYAEGLIDIEEGEVEAQVDWDGLIEFIERILPLILQLIGLFG